MARAGLPLRDRHAMPTKWPPSDRSLKERAARQAAIERHGNAGCVRAGDPCVAHQIVEIAAYMRVPRTRSYAGSIDRIDHFGHFAVLTAILSPTLDAGI
jgi:hypothetical protein